MPLRSIGEVLQREQDGSVIDHNAVKTWIYPKSAQHPVRPYQLSICQEALFKNTLVCLPTGLGKTLIAAVVMYNYYRWFPSGKIIFVAPSRPLVAQQLTACQEILHDAISFNDVAHLEGGVPPTQRVALWRSKRVLFCTPQTAQNDLAEGRFAPQSVVCVVVDEAHKATNGYAYTTLVQQLREKNESFRVLALSATPGSDIRKIQTVINNLLISHIEIRTEDDPEVAPYTCHRQIETVYAPSSSCSSSCVSPVQRLREDVLKAMEAPIHALRANHMLLCNSPQFLVMPLIDELLRDWDMLIAERNLPLAAQQNLRQSALALRVLLQCKRYISEDQFTQLASLLKRERENNETLKRLTNALHANVHLLLTQSPAQARLSEKEREIAPKLAALVDVLLSHFRRAFSRGESTRALVFVRLRETALRVAAALGELDECEGDVPAEDEDHEREEDGSEREGDGKAAPLNALSQRAPRRTAGGRPAEEVQGQRRLIRPHAFVGQGSLSRSSASGKSGKTQRERQRERQRGREDEDDEWTDSEEPSLSLAHTHFSHNTAHNPSHTTHITHTPHTGLTQAAQAAILSSFSTGAHNVLVCTSVAEEGLDIAHCDLIALLDCAASPVALTQRLGRTGRKRDGRVVLVTTRSHNAPSQDVSSSSVGERDREKLESSRERVKALNALLQRAHTALRMSTHVPRLLPIGLPTPQVVFRDMDCISLSVSNSKTAAGSLRDGRERSREQPVWDWTSNQPDWDEIRDRPNRDRNTNLHSRGRGAVHTGRATEGVPKNVLSHTLPHRIVSEREPAEDPLFAFSLSTQRSHTTTALGRAAAATSEVVDLTVDEEVRPLSSATQRSLTTSPAAVRVTHDTTRPALAQDKPVLSRNVLATEEVVITDTPRNVLLSPDCCVVVSRNVPCPAEEQRGGEREEDDDLVALFTQAEREPAVRERARERPRVSLRERDTEREREGEEQRNVLCGASEFYLLSDEEEEDLSTRSHNAQTAHSLCKRETSHRTEWNKTENSVINVFSSPMSCNPSGSTRYAKRETETDWATFQALLDCEEKSEKVSKIATSETLVAGAVAEHRNQVVLPQSSSYCVTRKVQWRGRRVRERERESAFLALWDSLSEGEGEGESTQPALTTSASHSTHYAHTTHTTLHSLTHTLPPHTISSHTTHTTHITHTNTLTPHNTRGASSQSSLSLSRRARLRSVVRSARERDREKERENAFLALSENESERESEKDEKEKGKDPLGKEPLRKDSLEKDALDEDPLRRVPLDATFQLSEDPLEEDPLGRLAVTTQRESQRSAESAIEKAVDESFDVRESDNSERKRPVKRTLRRLKNHKQSGSHNATLQKRERDRARRERERKLFNTKNRHVARFFDLEAVCEDALCEESESESEDCEGECETHKRRRRRKRQREQERQKERQRESDDLEDSDESAERLSGDFINDSPLSYTHNALSQPHTPSHTPSHTHSHTHTHTQENGSGSSSLTQVHAFYLRVNEALERERDRENSPGTFLAGRVGELVRAPRQRAREIARERRRTARERETVRETERERAGGEEGKRQGKRERDRERQRVWAQFCERQQGPSQMRERYMTEVCDSGSESVCESVCDAVWKERDTQRVRDRESESEFDSSFVCSDDHVSLATSQSSLSLSDSLSLCESPKRQRERKRQGESKRERQRERRRLRESDTQSPLSVSLSHTQAHTESPLTHTHTHTLSHTQVLSHPHDALTQDAPPTQPAKAQRVRAKRERVWDSESESDTHTHTQHNTHNNTLTHTNSDAHTHSSHTTHKDIASHTHIHTQSSSHSHSEDTERDSKRPKQDHTLTAPSHNTDTQNLTTLSHKASSVGMFGFQTLTMKSKKKDPVQFLGIAERDASLSQSVAVFEDDPLPESEPHNESLSLTVSHVVPQTERARLSAAPLPGYQSLSAKTKRPLSVAGNAHTLLGDIRPQDWL